MITTFVKGFFLSQISQLLQIFTLSFYGTRTITNIMSPHLVFGRNVFGHSIRSFCSTRNPNDKNT